MTTENTLISLLTEKLDMFDSLTKRCSNLEKELEKLKDQVNNIDFHIYEAETKPSVEVKKEYPEIPYLSYASSLINNIKDKDLYDLLEHYVIVKPLGFGLYEIFMKDSIGSRILGFKTHINPHDRLITNCTKTMFYEKGINSTSSHIKGTIDKDSKIYHQKYLKFMKE